MGDFYVVRRGSTSLSNKVILSGLSYAALGLLLTELSLRPGTPLGYRNMVKAGCGETQVRKAHKELEDAGFRHRLLVRGVDGSLKTVTVVTDESMSTREVLGEIDLPEGEFLVKVQTDQEPVIPKFEPRNVAGSGRRLASSHRAVDTAARCKQGKREAGESPGQSEMPSSHRAVDTAARSTVARSSTAGRSPNTLRVKDYPPSPQPPSQSQSDVTVVMADGSAPDGLTGLGLGSKSDDGVVAAAPAVGSSVADAGSETSKSASLGISRDEGAGVDESARVTSEGELVELARDVLPGSMQAMGPQHLVRVGRAIEQRVAAGWTRQQITQVLVSRQLPAQVRNLVALVLARLRDDVPVDAPPPEGVLWGGSEAGVVSPWSFELADGRVVTRRDLDCGLLAIDFNAACRSGRWSGGDRMDFAIAAGLERYLIS
ncbi:MAG: hypothetical protein SOW59_08435 [Corynebacterium sp.]|nr:hypothetical protein [Corynebacterium sp.]